MSSYVYIILCHHVYTLYYVIICIHYIMSSYVYIILCHHVYTLYYVIICIHYIMSSCVYIILCHHMYTLYYVIMCIHYIMSSYVYIYTGRKSLGEREEIGKCHCTVAVVQRMKERSHLQVLLFLVTLCCRHDHFLYPLV